MAGICLSATLGSFLSHWARVTLICVSKLTIIGSVIGLLSGRHLAIIWTNTGILLTRSLETNFSETFSEVQTFLFKKMHLEMSSANWPLFRLGFKELKVWSCHRWTGSKRETSHYVWESFYYINDNRNYWRLSDPFTHWGRDKMDAIYHTTCLMDFLEWKCVNFD